MRTVIMLGYRPGLERAVLNMGYDLYYIVPKFKPGLEGKRYCLVHNLEDGQEVLRAVLSHIHEPVVGVVTGAEKGVFTAALLRAWLNLSGERDYGRLLTFRDKFLQKRALEGVVPCARCTYLLHDDTFDSIAARIGTPFVVKPTNGAGSVHTMIIADAERFESEYAQHIKGSDIAFIAESLVHGTEYHLDGIWHNGGLLWLSVGQYSTNLINVNEGSTFGSQLLLREQYPELYEAAKALCERALAQLGVQSIVFHLECFDTSEGLVFSECAARLAGALVPEIISKTYGIDYYALQTMVSLGLDPTSELPQHKADASYAFVYLRDNPTKWLTKDEYLRHFNPIEIEYPESRETARQGIYNKIGYVIISDNETASLRERMQRIVRFNEVGHA